MNKRELERSERKGAKSYKICVKNKKRFGKKQTVKFGEIHEKKQYFVSIILKKDFKRVSLKTRKVRIGLIILFNLLNSKFKN
jgi:hypothetical protein